MKKIFVIGAGRSASSLIKYLIQVCAVREWQLTPRNVPRDRFNYNQSIGRSANEQMLLNLVRLRHRDVPVFLAVNSVITQYVYAGNLAVAGAKEGVPMYSTNGGVTWSNATGVPLRQRVEISYAPGSPNIVYASVSRVLPGTDYITVYRSTNGGQSYTLRTSGSGAIAPQRGRVCGAWGMGSGRSDGGPVRLPGNDAIGVRL